MVALPVPLARSAGGVSQTFPVRTWQGSRRQNSESVGPPGTFNPRFVLSEPPVFCQLRFKFPCPALGPGEVSAGGFLLW